MESDIVLIIFTASVMLLWGITITRWLKRSLKTLELSECRLFRGYLAEHPKDAPVPFECFGCEWALKCIEPYSVESPVQNASAFEGK